MSIESFRFEEEDDYARRTFSRQSGAGLHARITSYCKNLFLVVVLVLEWWWWGEGGGGEANRRIDTYMCLPISPRERSENSLTGSETFALYKSK